MAENLTSLGPLVWFWRLGLVICPVGALVAALAGRWVFVGIALALFVVSVGMTVALGKARSRLDGEAA